MKFVTNYFSNKQKWHAIFLVIIGVVLYANTFNNQLFWDDYDSIINNQYIRDWKYLPEFFSENLTAGAGIRDNYWRPLLLFSFSLDYHIGGLSPFIYHLQNLFWHIFSAILVYFLARNLIKDDLTAFISALFFLIHPLQTEAVTYVAGRADPMHTALLLLSFIFFYKYVNGGWPKKYYFISLAWFAAALLVKERAVIFPFLLSLYFITFHYEEFVKDWKKKTAIIFPFFIVLILYAILRLTVLHFTDTFDLGQPNNIGAQNWREQLLTYFQGIAVYAGLFFWPARLYMEKIINIPKTIFDGYVIWGIMIALGILVAIISSFRKNKLAAFGFLWFFIALSPSFHIYPIQGILYEHWLYFPMIGLLFIIGPLISALIQNKSKTVSISVLVIFLAAAISLSIRTIIRNNDWDTAVKFYEKNVASGGISARVYTNLGMSYDETQRYEEAIAAYQKAIDLDQKLFQPWYDMGNTEKKLGKNNEALSAYLKSIEINRYFFPAYYNSASIYLEAKNYDEAIKFLEEALKLDPENMSTNYNLGVVYQQKGEKDKAKEYLTKSFQPRLKSK